MGKFQELLCKAAATCRSTYAVDAQHLQKITSSTTDVADAIFCAITLHDNTPPRLEQLENPLAILLTRDHRLARMLEPVLAKAIEHDPSGFHDALERVWKQYRRGDWVNILPKPSERWLNTKTSAARDALAQNVHYNLLSGLLLIDGRPLGRLPSEITTHALYARTLNEVII